MRRRMRISAHVAVASTPYRRDRTTRMGSSPERHGKAEMEQTTDAQLVARAEVLLQSAARMARVGLIMERGCLSPEQRRAAFALQRMVASTPLRPEAKRAPLGFAYPNAR